MSNFAFVVPDEIFKQSVGFALIFGVVNRIERVFGASKQFVMFVKLGEFTVDVADEFGNKITKDTFGDDKIFLHEFAHFDVLSFEITGFLDGFTRNIGVGAESEDADGEICFGVVTREAGGVFHDAARGVLAFFIERKIDGAEELDDDAIGFAVVTEVADKGKDSLAFFGVNDEQAIEVRHE